MRIRVAACQILTAPSPKESAEEVLAWMRVASGEAVEVVAFPEACLCGYACEPDYWKSANPEAFRAAEKRIARSAKRLRLAVVLGTVHWDEGRLFNPLLLIDRDGAVVGRYSKTHLAENWPVPGRKLFVARLAGVASCFIICHDIRYPELVRLPSAAGAQVCYYCSNESGLLSEYKLSAYRAMPISRATENGIYLVMANAPANPQNLGSPSQSHGNSKIIHPDGNVICEAGYFEERLVSATIDLRAATRKVALRALNDETVLREWMRHGVGMVERLETTNSHPQGRAGGKRG